MDVVLAERDRLADGAYAFDPLHGGPGALQAAPNHQGDDLHGLGPTTKLAGGPAPDHLAPVEDDHPLAARLHLRQDVRREQDGLVAAQRAHEPAHLPDLVRVEPAGRLVQDQHRRIGHQGVSQAHPLPVALGELPDDATGRVPHAGLLERTLDGRRKPSSWHALEFGPVAQVLVDPHLRVDGNPLGQVAYEPPRPQPVPRHVQPPDADAPGGGRQVTRQDAQRRGLARAVRAEKAHDLSLRNLEGDVAKHRSIPEAAGQSLYVDHGVGSTQSARLLACPGTEAPIIEPGRRGNLGVSWARGHRPLNAAAPLAIPAECARADGQPPIRNARPPRRTSC